MTDIKLPANPNAILMGRNEAHFIADRISAAYWMHNVNNERALYLLRSAHEGFANLADEMGYDIKRKADAQEVPE